MTKKLNRAYMIHPNVYERRRKKQQQELPRGYWLLRANGEVEHCRWTGPLHSGVPSFDAIREMLGIKWIQAVRVLYRKKPHVMFIDEDGGLRPNAFNWRASMLLINASLMRAPKSAGTHDVIYDDLTEEPPIHPLILINAAAPIVGDVMLWEGEFGDHVRTEGAVESIYTRLKLPV